MGRPSKSTTSLLRQRAKLIRFNSTTTSIATNQTTIFPPEIWAHRRSTSISLKTQNANPSVSNNDLPHGGAGQSAVRRSESKKRHRITADLHIGADFYGRMAGQWHGSGSSGVGGLSLSLVRPLKEAFGRLFDGAQCAGRSGFLRMELVAPRLSIQAQLTVAVALCIFALLIRFPWFFVDVIDVDEGVFVLMGRSLAEGRLPYTEVWDNKPPLGFVFFAFIQLLMPGSLLFVRVAGTLIVGLSAVLVFYISLRCASMLAAFLSAALTVVSVSILIPSGQSVMMEHVALVPLLSALALVIRGRNAIWSYIAIGALLATAALVRLNLVIPAIAVVLGVLASSRAPQIRGRLVSSLWVVAGGNLVLLASYLPYVLSGHTSLYLRSVFAVPIAYSASNFPFSDTIRTMLGFAFPSQNLLSRNAAGCVGVLLWIGGAIGLIGPFLTSRTKDRAIAAMWLLVFCATVSFSIFLGGHAWGHYLIQVAPFFSIGVASVVSMVRLHKAVVAALLIGIFLFGATSVRSKYVEFVDTWKSGATLYSGDIFALVAHLEHSQKGDETYFFSDDILAYWLMNWRPVIPIAAFPSNIFMVDGIVRPLYGGEYDTERVMSELFAANPTIIVTAGEFEEWAFPLSPMFTKNLDEHYTLTDQFLGRSIYRLR